MAHLRGGHARLPQLLVPGVWARDIGDKPQAITLLGENIVVVREGGKVYALQDRCPHRGVPLSDGTPQFPGTVSCAVPRLDLRPRDRRALGGDHRRPRLADLRQASRSGPTRSRSGSAWSGSSSATVTPHAARRQHPRGAAATTTTSSGGRITVRAGQLAVRRRERLRRGPRQVPAPHRAVADVQGDAGVEQDPGRPTTAAGSSGSRTRSHWEADFPGLGTWSNKRWWKRMPQMPDAPAKAQERQPGDRRRWTSPASFDPAARPAARRLPDSSSTTSGTSRSTRTLPVRPDRWSGSRPARRGCCSSSSTSAPSGGSSTASSPARTPGW